MRLPMNTSLATLKPSGIRRINALAAQHPGCIALALGEPDFPTPDVISAEVTASLDRGDTHYPPNNGRPALREALSAYMGDAGLTFSADEVILTDGATEALSATFMAMLNPGDEVIIPTPAFGLYESIVVANHAKAVFLDTEPAQFQVDEEALRACVTPATKAIVICSPNNPTGDVAPLDFVAALCDACPGMVMVDEAYVEFADDSFGAATTAQGLIAEHPNLVILHTLSKAFGAAGTRLGYVIATPEVIDVFAAIRQIYSVNVLSQAAALACVRARDTYAPVVAQVASERERELAALRAMAAEGLPVEAWPSSANFVLVRTPHATRVRERLRDEYSILVRDFSYAPGLADCLRITVGTPQENDEVLAAFAALVKEEM